MIYLITYDLKSPGKDYSALYDAIKSLGDTFHPLESTWLLESNEDVSNIFAPIKSVTDDNDTFFIVEITSKQRQGWLPKTAWEWLENKNKI